jgi:hypothetical protein
VAEFLAAMLGKTLMAMLEALIMRLVRDMFVISIRQQQRAAMATAPAI